MIMKKIDNFCLCINIVVDEQLMLSFVALLIHPTTIYIGGIL